MHLLFRDFVSQDSRQFTFRIGRRIASSLSGFLTGVIVASIVWVAAFWVTGTF